MAQLLIGQVAGDADLQKLAVELGSRPHHVVEHLAAQKTDRRCHPCKPCRCHAEIAAQLRHFCGPLLLDRIAIQLFCDAFELLLVVAQRNACLRHHGFLLDVSSAVGLELIFGLAHGRYSRLHFLFETAIFFRAAGPVSSLESFLEIAYFLRCIGKRGSRFLDGLDALVEIDKFKPPLTQIFADATQLHQLLSGSGNG